MSYEDRWQTVTPDAAREAEKTKGWLQACRDSMHDYGAVTGGFGFVLIVMFAIYFLYLLVTGGIPA